MKTTTLLFAGAFALVPMLGNATVWRVNNNPVYATSGPQCRTSLQVAITDAANNDTIHVEASPNGYGNAIVSNKLLVIIGPGYNLGPAVTENNGLQMNTNEAMVNLITFDTGSDSSIVTGVFFISSGGGLQVFNREASPSDKVGQVIDLIDRQYVDTVEKNELVDEVLQHMLQRLDPHSYYISAAELSAAQEPLEGSFDGIGVEFAIQHDTVVVISPVEGGPSEALGIRAGDRIIKADSVVLAGVEVTNDQVMKNLRGPSGSEVTVLLLRNGRAKPFEVLIKRGKIPIHSVAATLMTDDGTGYIKLVRFAKNTHEEFLAAAEELTKQGMKRLVLDLRGNGGGFLNSAILLADEFLPDGNTIVYTQGRNSPRRDITATSDGSYEKLPLAILIDEGSASASEIIAGAIQDNDRGTIVGRRSFGKGLVQEHVDLPDHSAVRLTTARYYTPSGRSIQKPYGKGIDYEDDFTARYEHGELLSADSIHLDSTRAFTTLGGRTCLLYTSPSPRGRTRSRMPSSA